MRTGATGTPDLQRRGEMAGQPKSFLMLLGMGLRNFSMSPAFVPSIKQLASRVSVTEAEAIFQKAAKFKTTGQVRRFMTDKIQDLAPDLAILDTST